MDSLVFAKPSDIVDIANDMAPEHLEIISKNPKNGKKLQIQA